MSIANQTLVFLLVATCSTIGCKPQDISEFNRKYLNVHRSAALELKTAVELERFFDEVDHFIIHYGLHDNGVYEWRSTGFYSGQFKVALACEVFVDYDNETVKPVGEPDFVVNEIVRVDDLEDGRVKVKFGRQWSFGNAEWQEFVESIDYAKLGFPEKSIAVDGVEKYIRRTRDPRILVSLTEQDEKR